MSEPDPPTAGDPSLAPPDDVPASAVDWTMTPVGATDIRDLDMNRLDPGASALDPGVIHLTGPTRGTVIRQPDGTWTFVPEPPPVAPPQAPPSGPTDWSQPAGTVAGRSLVHAPGGLLATLATLATLAIVGVVGVVGIALVSGGDGDNGTAGTAAPGITSDASLAPTETLAESPFPMESINSGAAEANRLVIEMVRRCARDHGVTEQRLDGWALTFEAVPGVLPDPFEGPHVPAIPPLGPTSALYTVTITSTSTGIPYSGTHGRWTVNIETGDIAPSWNGHGEGLGEANRIWGLFASWCGKQSELGDDF